MGDFAAIDLWEVSYVKAGPTTPCTGCGGLIEPDDRCYGARDDIWHSRCWPARNHERKELEDLLGRWQPPVFTPRAAASHWKQREDTR